MRSFEIVFFNDTATAEIYTLSLHDALPIYDALDLRRITQGATRFAQHVPSLAIDAPRSFFLRSEEYTSELQSRQYLVCRLLLENKKLNPEDLPPEHKPFTYNFIILVISSTT